MNILITTGIFPPEAGGPATLAPLIASKLVGRGHSVKVVTYSDDVDGVLDTYDFEVIRVVRRGKLSNYWRYFKAVLRELSSYDLVYSLDWFSAGVPVSLACRVKRKRYIVRIGGDYGWERYLDWGGEPLSIREFYEKGVHRKGKMNIFFHFIEMVLSGATKIIFNSDVQKELYEKYYGIGFGKGEVIYNPIPEIESVEGDLKKEIVFAGRLEIKNNVSLLVDAFAEARIPEFKLIIIGDGLEEENLKEMVREKGIGERVEFVPRLPQKEVIDHLSSAWCVVLPSWTDVSPNIAYEVLGLGTPVLISKENYLPFGGELLTFDPHSSRELTSLLEKISDYGEHERYKQKISSIEFAHSVDDFIDEHEKLCENVLS